MYKTYTLSELASLALQTDSLEVMKFINTIADKQAKEEAEEIQELEDNGSEYDQMGDYMEI